jgi:predicted phosphoribosyltransferase
MIVKVAVAILREEGAKAVIVIVPVGSSGTVNMTSNCPFLLVMVEAILRILPK